MARRKREEVPKMAIKTRELERAELKRVLLETRDQLDVAKRALEHTLEELDADEEDYSDDGRGR